MNLESYLLVLSVSELQWVTSNWLLIKMHEKRFTISNSGNVGIAIDKHLVMLYLSVEIPVFYSSR